jgi:hypothetical protein
MSCQAQDTVVYCQTCPGGICWCSNCYTFCKESKESNHGTFAKSMSCDDGQHWYGTGSFTEFKNKILLDSFSLVRTIYRIGLDTLMQDYNVHDTTIIPGLTYYKAGETLIFRDGKQKTIFTKRKN